MPNQQISSEGHEQSLPYQPEIHIKYIQGHILYRSRSSERTTPRRLVQTVRYTEDNGMGNIETYPQNRSQTVPDPTEYPPAVPVSSI